MSIFGDSIQRYYRTMRIGTLRMLTQPAIALLMAALAPQALADCDPQELAKLLADDVTLYNKFGHSVAVSGETMLIGAYDNDLYGGEYAGSVFVLVGEGETWTQKAKLTAPNPTALDLFGYSVAISGNTAVIGAPLDGNAGGVHAGAVYIFVRSGDAWIQQAKLTAADPATEDDFGCSVAIAGDTVVVGACYDDHAGGIDAGSVYIFVRSGEVWTQQAKLTAADPASIDYFGYAVTISGETVVIGAHYDSYNGKTSAGSAYVFVRSGALWSQQAKLTPDDAANYDYFGHSVAISGDTALIGSEGDDHAGGDEAGSAYVFVRSGTLWSQQAKLTADDAAEEDYFGSSVAITGDTALIGSPVDDYAGGGDAAGSAYVFVRSGALWSQQAKLTANDAARGDYFGSCAAISGDTALIGAPLNDEGEEINAGSAYVFDLNCTFCLGDLDGDNDVDLADLATLLAHYGTTSGATYADGDLDEDGDVDLSDLALLLSLYGQPCP